MLKAGLKEVHPPRLDAADNNSQELACDGCYGSVSVREMRATRAEGETSER